MQTDKSIDEKLAEVFEEILDLYKQGLLADAVKEKEVGRAPEDDSKYIGKVVIRNGCKEWSCKHGVGHYVEKVNPNASTVHGCDGCCSNKKIVKRDLRNTPNPEEVFSV